MKKFARGLALTVVALIGLVPIQATSAMAAPETLNVEPEVVLRITGSIQRYTATLSAAAAADRTLMYDTDGILGGDQPACNIAMGATSCSFIVQETTPTDYEALRVYVNDPASPPTTIPCGTPVFGTDCDATEEQDEAATPGAQTEPDDTDVVALEFADGVLNVEPETSQKAPNDAISLTATVQTQEATPRPLIANVDAEILGGTPPSPNTNKVPGKADFECNTTATAGCSLTYTAGPNSGVDKVQSWIDLNDDLGCATCTPAQPATGDETTPGATYEADANEDTTEGTTDEPDDTDVVEVELSNVTPTLDLGPETQTKTTGGTASITASVTLAGIPQTGVAVAAAFLSGSPNSSATLTGCTTTAAGTCNLTYTGNAAGPDRVQGAIDTDANGQPDIDTTEDVSTNGGTAEPDGTDVVQVSWTGPTPPPPPPDGGDDGKCEQAKKKLKKAKKALKKAKKSGDEDRIAKAKKKVKRAKNRKTGACAGA